MPPLPLQSAEIQPPDDVARGAVCETAVIAEHGGGAVNVGTPVSF